VSYDDDEMVLALLPSAIFNRNGWFRANCPFCPTALGKDDKRRSFGIHAGGAYHCFRCYTRGKLSEIPDWAGLGLSEHIEKAPDTEDVDFFEEVESFEPLWQEPGLNSIVFEGARAYLEERKLSRRIWEYACIGAAYRGRYANRIVVPIFNNAGDEWVGFVSRWWERKPPEGVLPYRYPPGMTRDMFYDERLLDKKTDEPLLIVEGVLDALPYAGQAVACLGKPTNWQKQRLTQVRDRPIAVCLDGDAWEEAEGLSLLLRLEGIRSGFVKLPAGRDPNDVEPAWLRDEARRCLA
jgi:hypothetical protein